MQAKKPKNGVKIKPKSKEHYVNSREFKEAIAKYYDTDVCSEELGEMITKIAHGLSYAPNFINYSYKDEMIGDAVVKMNAIQMVKSTTRFHILLQLLFTHLLIELKKKKDIMKL